MMQLLYFEGYLTQEPLWMGKKGGREAKGKALARYMSREKCSHKSNL